MSWNNQPFSARTLASTLPAVPVHKRRDLIELKHARSKNELHINLPKFLYADYCAALIGRLGTLSPPLEHLTANLTYCGIPVFEHGERQDTFTFENGDGVVLEVTDVARRLEISK